MGLVSFSAKAGQPLPLIFVTCKYSFCFHNDFFIAVFVIFSPLECFRELPLKKKKIEEIYVSHQVTLFLIGI